MTKSALVFSGLVIPPAAWAASTQFGLVLPYPDCRSHAHSSLVMTVSVLLISLLAAGLSRYAASGSQARMQLFLGNLGCLFALAVSFALFLQGAASWLIDPCLF